MKQIVRIKKEVMKKGYVPGTFITKSNQSKTNQSKTNHVKEKQAPILTKKSVVIRGLV